MLQLSTTPTTTTTPPMALPHHLVLLVSAAVMALVLQLGHCLPTSGNALGIAQPLPDADDTAATTECVNCRSLIESERRRIEQIKRDILEKLGFDRPPNGPFPRELPEVSREQLLSANTNNGLQQDSPFTQLLLAPNQLLFPSPQRATTDMIFAFANTCMSPLFPRPPIQ